MSRDIHCSRCQKYIGEVRDAKLMKDIVHTCGSCQQKLVAAEMAYKYVMDKKNDKSDGIFGVDFGDIFGDTFGKQ